MEAHGTFTTAKCRSCLKEYQGKELEGAIFQGEVAYCTTSTCKVSRSAILRINKGSPVRAMHFGTSFCFAITEAAIVYYTF